MTSTDETNKLTRKKKLEMIGATTSGLENLTLSNNNSNSDLDNSGGILSSQKNKLTTKSILKNNSNEKLTDGQSNYLSSSNIQLESTSLSSLSSSPSTSTSTALQNNNLFTYNSNISADKASIGSNTSNKSPTLGTSTNLIDSSSSSLATNSNHGSKSQISSSLREKLAKAIKKTTSSSSSSSNNKKLISTNSESLMTQHQSKLRRGMMRSNQGTSFFSRSCPGEELTAYGLEEEDLNDLNNENNNINSSNNNPTTLNSPLNNQNTKEKKSKSGDFIKASRQTMLAKSFIQFTTKVVRSKKRSDATSSVTSSNASMYSTQDDPFNTSRPNNVNRIGNYEIDFDKLAKELALPSLNKPLTSFKEIKPDESELNDDNVINKISDGNNAEDNPTINDNNDDNNNSKPSVASPSPPSISKTLVRSDTNKSDIE
jgi:hypothetical protein